MNKQIHILLTVFSLLSTIEAIEEPEQILQENDNEIETLKERLSLTGKKLHISLTEQKEKDLYLEDKLNELNINILSIKNALNITQGKLVKAQQELRARGSIIDEIEKDVSFLKEPPWTFFCAGDASYQGIVGAILTYPTLLYSSTNVDGADLDITTGVFISGFPGSYTVTWSMWADDSPGDPGL